MRRKLLALFGATAVALVGAVAFAAGPAQAATPQVSATSVVEEDNCLTPQKVESTEAPSLKTLSFGHHRATKPCRQADVVDNCDGTATVTVSNTGNEDALKVLFKVNGKPSKWLGGGESETFTIAVKDASDIEISSLFFGDGFHWVTLVEHEWTWNASCLEVTSVSNCDGTFKVSVHNTSTEDGEFIWSLGLNDSTETKIEAGATLSENFTKGDIVQIRVGKDNEVVKTLEFVQPKDCATASPTPVTPTTSAPAAPQPQVPDLPTTGDSLTKPAVTGVAAIALGLLIVGSMLLKRRRTGAEVSTEE
jgi:hypothetical protein